MLVGRAWGTGHGDMALDTQVHIRESREQRFAELT